MGVLDFEFLILAGTPPPSEGHSKKNLFLVKDSTLVRDSLRRRAQALATSRSSDWVGGCG